MAGEDEKPALRTRVTERVNIVVWNLPLPRRAQVLISQLVYHNPPIPAARVVETLTALEAAEVRSVVVGGWGVDALVGRQLRPHRDLDLIVDSAQVDRAGEVLLGLGYESWHADESPEPLGDLEISAAEAYRDGALRVVDLHGADLAQLELSEGVIDGEPVTCISAEQQLQAQVGKTWTPDRRNQRRINLEAVEAAIEGDGAGY